MALTDKREKFVQWLIKGKSQREAYKLAGYKADVMTDNAIDVEASKIFKAPEVSLRYEELRSRLVKEAEDECIVTVKDLLREYAKIGFADIKDFLQYKTALTIVGHDKETGDPIIDYAPVIEMKDSDQVDGTLINEVSVSKDGTLKFKLHDKKGALDSMAKHLGMFVDKVEHSGQVVIIKGENDLED